MRFAEFADEWQITSLSNLGSFTSGTGFPEKYQGDTSLDIPFYKVSDMNLPRNTKYMLDVNNTVDDSIIKQLRTRSIDTPSIVFAKVGAAIFGERKRIVKHRFLIDNNMMAFTPNNQIDLEFCHACFYRTKLSHYTQIGALPSYNASDLSIINFGVPSMEEQRKIAKFIILIDNKIEKHACLVEHLKKYKRGVLQKLFAPKNVKWKRQRFGDFITEHSEKTSETNIYPICSLTVEDGIILKPERYYREFLITKEGDSYKILRDGWFAYNPMNAHIGAIAPNKLGKSVSVSGYYNIFSVKRSETNTFWEEFLKCYSMLCYYKVIATGSLIEKQRVHYSQFVDIELPLPSIEEQIKISSLLDALNRKLNNAESTYSNLKKLKAGILQKIFVE